MKVITADEMKRIETLAYSEGCSDADFMENAGQSIADATLDFIEEHVLEKKVTLLVGKGNNGGDALVAGRLLLSKGYSVTAYHPFPLEECTPLCRAQVSKYKESGGKFTSSDKWQGVLLDGLVGTGFKGKAEGLLLDTIQKANDSGLPILAIDIPSGLNGTTGEVGSLAIEADVTFFLGLPKLGFFWGDGWNHVGELVACSFGMPEKYFEKANPEAYLADDIDLLLPEIKRNRHKYEAGYVLAIAGSLGMTGAALLASTAVLRTGAGIVRLFFPKAIFNELAASPFEIIKEAWDYKPKRVLEEAKRAKAALIGPGLGRTKEVKSMLKKLLAKLPIPAVLDADALFFLSQNPSWKIPKQSLLTPHHQEMQRLLGHTPLSLQAVQHYVEKKQVTLVLKGAPTFIFDSYSKPLIITRGDPGMATAGSGDVLTGILASLISQGVSIYEATVLGVTLHGAAGEMAALKKTTYCMVASDIIHNLPYAFREVSDYFLEQLEMH